MKGSWWGIFIRDPEGNHSPHREKWRLWRSPSDPGEFPAGATRSLAEPRWPSCKHVTKSPEQWFSIYVGRNNVSPQGCARNHFGLSPLGLGWGEGRATGIQWAQARNMVRKVAAWNREWSGPNVSGAEVDKPSSRATAFSWGNIQGATKHACQPFLGSRPVQGRGRGKRHSCSAAFTDSDRHPRFQGPTGGPPMLTAFPTLSLLDTHLWVSCSLTTFS